MAAEPLKLPEVKTPEGSIDVSAANGLVGRLLAYRMLEEEGAEIVRLIGAHEHDLGTKGEEKKKPLRVLLVANPDLSAGEMTYWTVLEGIRRERRKVNCHRGPSDVADAGGAIPGEQTAGVRRRNLGADHEALAFTGPVGVGLSTALAAAPTLVGMLRTDYLVKGGDVAIGQQALLAVVAGKIVGEKWEAIIDGFDLLAESEVFAAFEGLVTVGQALRGEIELARALFAPGGEPSTENRRSSKDGSPNRMQP